MAAYAAIGFAAAVGCRAVSSARNQIHAALTLIGQHLHYQQFAESVLREGNQDLRRRVFARFQMEHWDRLLPLVEEAVRNGEVRDDIPAKEIHDILIFFLQNLSEISGQVSLHEYEKQGAWFLNFLENGLANKG